MRDFPFSVNGLLCGISPIEEFAGKKDPTKKYRCMRCTVRLDDGREILVCDWNPPSVPPSIPFASKVRVDFNEVKRFSELGSWQVRGVVIPIK